ncbi:MAG TPA: hypothetical protein VJO13_11925, partial [Ktedonobacterales bacterium]|nr:hypothetical protein [Ktedonobacterales bacterium]
GGQRAVTNGAGKGSVSAFHDGKNGVLTSIGGSPYADNQTAPCWVTITPNGQYAYTVDAGHATVSAFAVSAQGSLSEFVSSPIALPTGATPFGIIAD